MFYSYISLVFCCCNAIHIKVKNGLVRLKKSVIFLSCLLSYVTIVTRMFIQNVHKIWSSHLYGFHLHWSGWSATTDTLLVTLPLYCM